MKELAVISALLLTGLTAGLFFGLEMKMGQDVSPTGLVIQAGKMFCQGLSTHDSVVSANCKNQMNQIAMFALLLGILEVVILAALSGSVAAGIIIYIIGFVAGFSLTLVG